FDRFELKYLINKAQVSQLQKVLADYMSFDDQGDNDGRYIITSLYYDSVDYKAYWDKVEGHRFRRKVRVRVYGNDPVQDDTPVFAEIKQRINKTLQKKRVRLPYQAALALCGEGEIPPGDWSENEVQIIDEIRYLYYTLQLQPACIVSYHRLAFDGHEYDPGLRVTFDSQLKGRTHDLTLQSAGFGESRFFLPPEWTILEVKANHRVPYWLTELINKHRCTLRRISKYCTALEQCEALLQRQHVIY
ncbi:MAG: polyphosphate polymerase domain-containing protein, partial [Anaerolineae bacterium]|nr:polyphosphate polymerase domain-containing protein [Anaerolineae bacterium]